MEKIRIIIDDVFYAIDTESEDNKMLNLYEFSECLEILLNKSQYDEYIMRDTRRTFPVTKKSI